SWCVKFELKGMTSRPGNLFTSLFDVYPSSCRIQVDYCCVLRVTLILSTRSYSPPKWIVQPKNVRLGFRASFSAANNRVSVELWWQYSVSDEIPSVMPLIKCLNDQFAHQDSAGH